MELSGNEALLDLGCGNGFLLELLAPNMREGEITGLDIAPGVLALAEERMKNSSVPCHWITGPADNLSMLNDSSFDRVMANFMMHYVVDIAESVRETRRVLRRGGRFVLTTDSSKSMVEMYEVHFSALIDMNAPERLFRSSPKGRISYDNADEWLYGIFEKVVVIDQDDQLRFTASQPFMAFYSQGHNYCCAATVGREGLPVDFFTELHERVEEKVNKIIDERGQFTVTKLAGLFVAS